MKAFNLVFCPAVTAVTAATFYVVPPQGISWLGYIGKFQSFITNVSDPTQFYPGKSRKNMFKLSKALVSLCFLLK